MIRNSNVNDPFTGNSIWVTCNNMINDCRTATTYASWTGNKLPEAKKCYKISGISVHRMG